MASSIGGIRCQRCAKMLTQNQINHRLVSELHEDQAQIFKLIGALQKAGLDECGACHQWSKDFLIIGDRCRCFECVKSNPEGILAEDEVVDYEGAKVAIIRFLSGRGLQIKWKGELLETYKRIAR
jgi:hypothetical protein